MNIKCGLIDELIYAITSMLIFNFHFLWTTFFRNSAARQAVPTANGSKVTSRLLHNKENKCLFFQKCFPSSLMCWWSNIRRGEKKNPITVNWESIVSLPYPLHPRSGHSSDKHVLLPLKKWWKVCPAFVSGETPHWCLRAKHGGNYRWEN